MNRFGKPVIILRVWSRITENDIKYDCPGSFSSQSFHQLCVKRTIPRSIVRLVKCPMRIFVKTDNDSLLWINGWTNRVRQIVTEMNETKPKFQINRAQTQ